MPFRQPKEKTLQARALTDPRPRFVSLVQAGANQTPLRSVKVDLIHVENEPMTKIAALKAEGHEVKRMLIKTGKTFPDEAAVQKFLEDGGYDASTLKATDEGFELTNEDGEFTDDVRVVEVSEDITVEVGKLVMPEADEADAETKAKDQANKAGSAITDVKVIDAKKDEGEEAGEDGTKKGEGEEDKSDEDTTLGDEDNVSTREGQMAAGIDGSLKPIRQRSKPTVEAEKEDCACGKTPCGCEGEDATKQSEADCGPDEVFMDGKCVKSEVKVGDEVFQVMTEPLTDLPVTIPAGSFEVTDKVETISGDCGPGHTMISAGGRSFCVPTGDRSPISDSSEVTAPNAGGGQDSAGPAGTTPVSGQTQRTEEDADKDGGTDEVTEGATKGDGDAGDGDAGGSGSAGADAGGSNEVKVGKANEGTIKTEAIAAKFDEFAAHFSDGMSLSEVMDDANDGFPPGLEMVILAAVMAMRNNFLAGNVEAVRQVGTDLGEVAAMLGSMFEVAERAEDRQKFIDIVSGTYAELGWPQPESEGEGGDEENAAKGTDQDDGVLATALSELTATMKSIAVGLSEVQAKQDAQAEDATDLADRVEQVETLKQTRKGADDGDAGAAANAPKESPIAGIALRGALGITQSATRSDKFGG